MRTHQISKRKNLGINQSVIITAKIKLVVSIPHKRLSRHDDGIQHPGRFFHKIRLEKKNIYFGLKPNDFISVLTVYFSAFVWALFVITDDGRIYRLRQFRSQLVLSTNRVDKVKQVQSVLFQSLSNKKKSSRIRFLFRFLKERVILSVNIYEICSSTPIRIEVVSSERTDTGDRLQSVFNAWSIVLQKLWKACCKTNHDDMNLRVAEFVDELHFSVKFYRASSQFSIPSMTE